MILVPILLLTNNAIAYVLSKNINKTFKDNLCPMMFEEKQWYVEMIRILECWKYDNFEQLEHKDYSTRY